MGQSSLPGGCAYNLSLNAFLHAFLCAGRCATWHSAPQYFTNLQALHTFRLASALPQEAQWSDIRRKSQICYPWRGGYAHHFAKRHTWRRSSPAIMILIRLGRGKLIFVKYRVAILTFVPLKSWNSSHLSSQEQQTNKTNQAIKALHLNIPILISLFLTHCLQYKYTKTIHSSQCPEHDEFSVKGTFNKSWNDVEVVWQEVAHDVLHIIFKMFAFKI